ncbi:hypothetical protein [Streptomyces sp.]|uniref:hypothetical protein n=1 Tax=Streptomyces sp. TaxID=1931 RepID=UPI002F3E7955
MAGTLLTAGCPAAAVRAPARAARAAGEGRRAVDGEGSGRPAAGRNGAVHRDAAFPLGAPGTAADADRRGLTLYLVPRGPASPAVDRRKVPPTVAVAGEGLDRDEAGRRWPAGAVHGQAASVPQFAGRNRHSEHGGRNRRASARTAEGRNLLGAGLRDVALLADVSVKTVPNVVSNYPLNPSRAGNGGILRHMPRIDADRFLPVPPEALPWAPAPAVAGSPSAFTAPRPVGEGIEHPDPQVDAAGGYGFALRPPARPGLPPTAAVPHGPDGGRTPEVRTTGPLLQIRAADRLDSLLAGTGGRVKRQCGPVGPKTRHPRDSPNRPEYPSSDLRPGAVSRSRQGIRFAHLASGGGRS